MCDEFVVTPCYDEITGDVIEGCPFWIGETKGSCLLVQRGMNPEDCPMDEKFHWWGYQSRVCQPVFSGEQVEIIREFLVLKEE